MLVSVIMPVFNSIQFLQESIDSILNQSHTDFEFIILDDGSTEPVFDLVKACPDPRIIALRNSENIGLTKSLNICLDKVRGDFVVRHDSDDVSLPTRIEKELELFEEGVGWVTCWNDVIMQKNGVWKVRPSGDRHRVYTEDLLGKYVKKNTGCDAGCIYSIEAVRKVGYFEERVYIGQTYNYNRRIQKFLSAKVIPEVLYLRRSWNGRIGKRIKLLHPEWDDINWSKLCNEYADEKPIITEREKHSWED